MVPRWLLSGGESFDQVTERWHYTICTMSSKVSWIVVGTDVPDNVKWTVKMKKGRQNQNKEREKKMVKGLRDIHHKNI